MTSSSSPGHLPEERGHFLYRGAATCPALIVNVMRGGPGLGGIQPSQSDYWQATRGGGHGDYRSYSSSPPSSVQEMVGPDRQRAFDMADQYRMPAMILADGMIGPDDGAGRASRTRTRPGPDRQALGRHRPQEMQRTAQHHQLPVPQARRSWSRPIFERFETL